MPLNYARKLECSSRAYSGVSSSATPSSIHFNGHSFPTDEWTNIPPFILALADRKLHQNSDHPIGILRDLIESNLANMGYTFYNDFAPAVTRFQNFDVLGFPPDHPGRSRSDTYYFNRHNLLRTHTSAHEHECFQKCQTPGYIITADVYRKDEIDRTHYPAFHQMEGARLWSLNDVNLTQSIQRDIDAIPKTNLIVEDLNPDASEQNPRQPYMSPEHTRLVSTHLKKTVEYLVDRVFTRARESARLAGSLEPFLDEPLRVRWNREYFPWTSPSWEIEVLWNGTWLECCGCGVVQQQVLLNSDLGSDKLGWAFGIGLDRLAMILFGIPDIRLFWSHDERFHRQFRRNEISKFVPYSKHPGITRDVSFWLPSQSKVHANEVMEIVRGHAGDLAESVALVDEFTHPKTQKQSQCYRINYQSMDRNLTNAEIEEMHKKVEADLKRTHGVTIR